MINYLYLAGSAIYVSGTVLNPSPNGTGAFYVNPGGTAIFESSKLSIPFGVGFTFAGVVQGLQRISPSHFIFYFNSFICFFTMMKKYL